MDKWLNRCHVGDCRDVLRQMAADGVRVQCVVTSPPYWGLRDYGIDSQLGLESTPKEYLTNMVEVFRLVREVLADDGTIWVNMGDSYTGNSGIGRNDAGRNFTGGGGNIEGSGNPGKQGIHLRRGTGLKPKDLVGMPWRLAFSLQADGWYLRSDIIWAKPNPMPESCTDRPTKSHEYVFLLSKKANYFYDAEAVRKPFADERMGNPGTYRSSLKSNSVTTLGQHGKGVTGEGWNKDGAHTGRNLRTVWTIATQAYSEAHFATFPQKLVEPCVLAGTSQKGHCPECGRRWERVTDKEFCKLADRRPTRKGLQDGVDSKRRDINTAEVMGFNRITTTGWQPSCACGTAPVTDVVLDPFFGSGTVGQVSENLGRNWVGIELNEKYVAMSEKRTAQEGMALG